jgi:hypothetical protein
MSFSFDKESLQVWVAFVLIALICYGYYKLKKQY